MDEGKQAQGHTRPDSPFTTKLVTSIVTNHRTPQGSPVQKAWDVHGVEEVEDDEDDDDDEDGAPKPYNWVKTLFDDKLQDEEYSTFSQRYRSDVEKYIRRDLPKQEVPLLNHLLLYHDSLYGGQKTHSKFRHLVKLLLEVGREKRYNVLTQKSLSRKAGENTCLHLAAKESRKDFLETIFDTASEAEISEAIEQKDWKGQTCLHTAIIYHDVPDLDYIQLLLKKATPKALLIQRESTDDLDEYDTGIKKDSGTNNTPLHDFVHFRLCKVTTRKCRRMPDECDKCQRKLERLDDIAQKEEAKYLETLKLFIDKCPDALAKLNARNESPYLFHSYTRNILQPDWKDLEFSEQKYSSKREKQDDQPEVRRKEEKQAWPESAAAKTRSGIFSSTDKSTTHGVAAVKKSGVSGSDRLSTHRAAAEAFKPTADASSVKQRSGHKSPKREPFEPFAVETARMLLQHSLSQSTFADTCLSLFGHGLPSSRLIFKAAGPISEKTTTSYQGLDLAPVLACVEVGLVPEPPSRTVISDAYPAEPGSMSDRGADIREQRMKCLEQFFDWLRTKKGVKRMVKLIVKDDPEFPCSDEVIEKCLHGFDVRFLDWNKHDTDIQCIRSKAENLRELWLSWSGRNSTLIGWSSKEYGLPDFPQLNRVHISDKTELESEERNETNLEAFKERLSNIQPRIEFERTKDGKAVALMHSRRQGDSPHSQEGNVWLKTVDDFVKVIKKRVPPEIRHKAKAIKVALVDDGVDLEQLVVPKPIDGWFPDDATPTHGSMNTCFVSDGGHGTEMARQIQRVCPYVNFYIAKLETTPRIYPSVAASAVEAINKAIDHGVNIISMSWTMYEKASGGGNKGDLVELSQALQRAQNLGILLYCSGEDTGAFQGTAYPASCQIPELRRIGSAGSYGKETEFVNLHNIDYLFPGELAVQGKKFDRGSSVACALAAGLAALILWCAEVHRVVQREKVGGSSDHVSGVEDFDFQKNGRMNRLFDKLKTPRGKLVNIVDLMKTAKGNTNDTAGELVRLCKQEIPEWRA